MINYYLLTKPGIVLGNLITLAAGFLLAARGNIDFFLFLATLLGLSCIMASACVFNNYIDRHIDKKMERTKTRALVTGAITHFQAICFAVILAFLGCAILLAFTNLLTVAIAGIGFFVYVVLYSFWKCHTVYATAIGSIAGAIPPVVGYCAVSNHFDKGALILFLMMVWWQMPHFYAIAMYRLKDYAAAGLPLLPIEKGIFQTKIHMALYIVIFMLTAPLLTVFNYTGMLYLSATILLSFIWLGLCLQGFQTKDDSVWGKKMFQFSLVALIAISLIIPFDFISYTK